MASDYYDNYDRTELLSKNLDKLFGRASDGRCRVCENPTHDLRTKYCSEKCRSIAYGVLSEYTWDAIRRRVLRQYDNKCVSCGTSARDPEGSIDIDHVRPLSRGGEAHDERNLQPLCEDCHREKGLSTTDHRPDADRDDADGRHTVRDRLPSYSRETQTRDTSPPAVRVLDRDRFTPEVESGLPREVGSTTSNTKAPIGERDEPSPPDELAQYIVDGIDRQGRDGLEAVLEYAGEKLDYLDWKAKQPVTAEEVLEDADSEEIGDVVETVGGTLQTKHIPCGPGCGGCPHGPYVYLYYRDENGQKTSRYVGKGEVGDYV